MVPPFLKICCIKSELEAEISLHAGADFLGFVSEMPDGPGVISLDEIARIIDDLPPGTKSVLLTSKRSAQDIHKQHQFVGSWGVQIVDHVDRETHAELRGLSSEIHIIQVVHVHDKSTLKIARNYYDSADHLLLDSGLPNSDSPSLGGTGRTHDWEVSRQICSESPVPVLLAGGINSENVLSALHGVKPAGIDLCSSLRSYDNLDAYKLSIFMSAFRSFSASDDVEMKS